jgi:hypothetical protein
MTHRPTIRETDRYNFWRELLSRPEYSVENVRRWADANWPGLREFFRGMSELEREDDMETRPIIYVAGPHRAKTRIGVWLNVRRAAKAAAYLTGRGWAVICPHCNSYWPSKFVNLPEDDWLESGIALLRRADAVVLLPGWERSAGAFAEWAEAKMRLRPIFEGIDTVPQAADFWDWCSKRDMQTIEQRRR